MPSLAVILASLSLLIWIALTFFRGAFWQLNAFDDDVAQHAPLRSWPLVVAIVRRAMEGPRASSCQAKN